MHKNSYNILYISVNVFFQKCAHIFSYSAGNDKYCSNNFSRGSKGYADTNAMDTDFLIRAFKNFWPNFEKTLVKRFWRPNAELS